MDINELDINQSLTYLWNALNKANKKGVYVIEESVIIFKCFNNIKNKIDN